MKKLLSILAVLTLLTTPFAYYQTAKADIYGSSLVAWYTLDSNDISGTTVTDKTGNGNTGTTANSPTQIAGVLGQALSFNGSNQYVNLGATTMLNSATSFTVSAWIKKPAGNFGNHDGIFSIGATGGRMPWIWGPLGAQNLQMQFQTTTGGAADCSVTSATLPANVWLHIVAWWNGSSCKFYINGQVSGTPDPTTGNTLITNTGNLGYIGHIDQYGYWPGQIDDVRVYNRALSASEVQQLYYMGISRHFNTLF